MDLIYLALEGALRKMKPGLTAHWAHIPREHRPGPINKYRNYNENKDKKQENAKIKSY